jgi:hypothetical protein
MWSGTPLFPEQASTMAGRVDALFFFLLAVSTFFSVLIATGGAIRSASARSCTA